MVNHNTELALPGQTANIATIDGVNITLDTPDTMFTTPIVDLTSDTGDTYVLEANKMYMFGERSILTISFDSGVTDFVNEYMFQFTSGSVATTLNVPASVVWLKEPDIQANKKYSVSIENNLGIIGEWNNE